MSCVIKECGDPLSQAQYWFILIVVKLVFRLSTIQYNTKAFLPNQRARVHIDTDDGDGTRGYSSSRY